MTTKIKFWQWPNLLAIDASAVALAWLWVFAEEQSVTLSSTAYSVLALSVWLTYLSDRLFDAAPRRKAQLLSARHQFAKRNRRSLWLTWTFVLLADVGMAAAELAPAQLEKGFALLLVCLTYTGLNHFLSRRFFPKELLVGLIFAGGPQVFLPEYTAWPCLTGYILLCMMNCLVIGWKESSVDAMLEVRSVASVLERRWLYPLLAVGLFFAFYSGCLVALLPSILALALLHFRHKRFNQECFRVLCDAALLIGPVLYWFGTSFS